MDEIIRYIRQRYQPSAIVVYGSFADGTNGEGSDFDALAITDKPHPAHDGAVVGGVPLDLFLYSPDDVEGDTDLASFVQVYDGKIALDESGLAARLISRVRDHVAKLPKKSAEENQHSVEWCEKMLSRAQRGDAEGYYRWHWLLIDSLEIYFDLCGKPYFGPKKALKELAKSNPRAAETYLAALKSFETDALRQWVALLRSAL